VSCGDSYLEGLQEKVLLLRKSGAMWEIACTMRNEPGSKPLWEVIVRHEGWVVTGMAASCDEAAQICMTRLPDMLEHMADDAELRLKKARADLVAIREVMG